jgi:hypothetical protein
MKIPINGMYNLFRPYSSDSGAAKSGPVAKVNQLVTEMNIPNPMRYSEMPRIPTSIETPNSDAMSSNPGDRIVVPKLETKIASETVSVTCLYNQ